MTYSTGHGVYRLLGVVIFLVLMKCASTGRYEGDSCTHPITNVHGRCTYLSDCPKAVANLHSYGIYPETCGFEGIRPVVCCEENTHITEKPFPTVYPGSKSKQKCKEYRELYKKTSYAPVNEECDFLAWNVLQGNKAKPNEFPHMASIGYEGEQYRKKSWLCSGALISDQFILTAAHCLADRPHGHPKYIRIGDLDLNSNQDDTITPQEFNVATLVMHPEFQPPSFYNDIGLIKMDRPAKFYPSVRPACLNTNPSLPDKQFLVSGWGEESHYSDKSSPMLKEILDFFPHVECTNSYKTAASGKRLRHGILDETQLCGVPHKNQEKCNIGTGVLQVYNKEEYCMYTIVGITSFGRTSNNFDIPEVFTKVAPYSQWIEGIIWPS